MGRVEPTIGESYQDNVNLDKNAMRTAYSNLKKLKKSLSNSKGINKIVIPDALKSEIKEDPNQDYNKIKKILNNGESDASKSMGALETINKTFFHDDTLFDDELLDIEEDDEPFAEDLDGLDVDDEFDDGDGDASDVVPPEAYEEHPSSAHAPGQAAPHLSNGQPVEGGGTNTEPPADSEGSASAHVPGQAAPHLSNGQPVSGGGTNTEPPAGSEGSASAHVPGQAAPHLSNGQPVEGGGTNTEPPAGSGEEYSSAQQH